MRRDLLKIISLSILSILFYPINVLIGANKKVINKDLTEQQKNIMFNEGTERPFSSSLLQEKRKGFYHCANCGAKLFASTSKFDSGTGWPSFSEALPGAFKTKTDNSYGMVRTGIIVPSAELIMGMSLTMVQVKVEKDSVITVFV